jgi:Right handed beta helix region
MSQHMSERSLFGLTRVFSLWIMALILGAGQLLAQPAKEDLHAVITAKLFVDDNNAGHQDGSALRPFKTVQQAINAAANGDVIAVAGGSYPQNIRVSEKAVRLDGGYASGFKTRDPTANPSHLRGDGKDSVVILYESGGTVVDGFLITGGGPCSVAAPQRVGGGFYVYGGTPTISHNVIEKNQSCPSNKPDEEARGGGIYANGDGTSLTLLNNTIRNNVSGRGAGVFSDGPKLVLRGNTIQNNIGVADHGGGVYLNSPNAEISHNRIEGNEIARLLGYGWGGGMIVVNKGGHYKLSSNIFAANYAPSLGAGFFADEGADASMDHDLVYGNKTKPDGEGAAVYVDGNESGVGSTLSLNHVTIADNISAPMVKGGAVQATWNSKLTVKNCIFWNNGGEDFAVDDKSKATVTYTLSQAKIKGTGNLSKDPLFVNPAKGDYRLSSNSPAVNVAEGGRASLGAYGGIATTSKTAAETPAVKPNKEDAIKPNDEPPAKVTPTAEKASKAYLLRGTAGELPSLVGDDNTKLSKLDGAVQVDLIDSFGQDQSKIADWTSFDALRLEIENKSVKELPLELNLNHAGTTNYATRVVAPFVLKPGKNEIRIAVADLKNTNSSAAILAQVKRWYIAGTTPATLLIGDIYLESSLDALQKATPGTLQKAPSSFGKPTVRNTEELRAAFQSAQPGTTIVLAPGRYSPDISVESLRGTKDKPIIIAAADERHPPLFAGGKVAFHFIGCSYITLRGVKVSGCTGNGINADDAGNPKEPSVGMVFKNIVIEDIGPKGTFNGLKLSGLDNFAVRGCTFSGWGGSAIDMVGCHGGVVQNCMFFGKPGFSQDTGVQVKGGSERIMVIQNVFKQAGSRAINLGGSTDLEFFRPKVRNYEAKDIEVAGNHIIGSRSPIAFASSIQCVVRHNTIVNPENWVLRILQEQPTDKFLPCQQGVFKDNLIIFDRRVKDFANVGEDTKPETFSFTGNAWFCTDGNRRPTLPTQETGGIYQVDPMLENAETTEPKFGSQDPRLLKIGAHAFQEVPTSRR